MKSSRDVVRQIVVVVSAIIAIVGSVIGSGFAGGTPIQSAAGGALSASATPIAPAEPAFSIWSVIYLGLIAYAVYQALPSQRESARQRLLGYWVAASLVLNAAWILSVQFDLLAASVPVIVVLLIVLIRTFFLCARIAPKNWVEAIIVDGTIGLYLGWVCVATAANVAAVLKVARFDGGALDATGWSILILAVAGVIGVLLAVRDRGRFAPSLALAWGIAWIAVGRATGEPRSMVIAIVAVVVAVVVLVATVILRLLPRR